MTPTATETPKATETKATETKETLKATVTRKNNVIKLGPSTLEDGTPPLARSTAGKSKYQDYIIEAAKLQPKAGWRKVPIECDAGTGEPLTDPKKVLVAIRLVIKRMTDKGDIKVKVKASVAQSGVDIALWVE